MAVRGAAYKRKKNDYYPTPQATADVVLNHIRFGFSATLCDPCAGKGSLMKAFQRHGYKAVGSDLNKGYDFLKDRFRWKNCHIVTNPPYGDRRASLSLAFIRRALAVTKPWNGTVAMLLPVDFDSGATRRDIFADCPAFAQKIILLDRVRFFRGKAGSSNHAWYIWYWRKRADTPPTLHYAKQYE